MRKKEYKIEIVCDNAYILGRISGIIAGVCANCDGGYAIAKHTDEAGTDIIIFRYKATKLQNKRICKLIKSHYEQYFYMY